MRLRIIATIDSFHFIGEAVMIVPDSLVEVWEPLKTSDDLCMCLCTGDLPVDSFKVMKKLKLRKEAAKEISEALTTALIEQMAKHDTHNGYKKEISNG